MNWLVEFSHDRMTWTRVVKTASLLPEEAVREAFQAVYEDDAEVFTRSGNTNNPKPLTITVRATR